MTFTGNEPIVMLEGGIGLTDEQDTFMEIMCKNFIYPIVLDDLYKNPSKIISLKFIQPKTIMLGTTGLFKQDIEHCFEMLKIAECVPDNVVFFFGEEKMRKYIDYFKQINENLKVFTIFVLDDSYELRELK